MPITYLDEEEEDFASPLRQTPLTQPKRRKITYFDEEPAERKAKLLPPVEEMFKPKPKPAGDSLLRQAADIPVGLAKGAAQGVRMFTDIAGADNPVSQSIRGVEDYLGNLMSAQAKEDQAEIARIMQDAQDKGVLDQVMAGVKAFSVAPVDMTVQALGTMAPVIVGGLAANTAKLAVTGIRGGAAAARGLTAGQMAAAQSGIGAGMGAGVVKGTIYDEVKNELISQGLSEDAAHQQAVKAQEYGGKNLDQILLGAGLGAAAATTGAEKIIGGILTKTGVAASKSRIGNALKTGITEAFPEAAQGAQEQLAANLALQREGMEVPTTRGVFSSGALEGIAGFGVGAPLGAIQKASVAEDAAIKADEANAPQTAAAIRAAGQKAATTEKDISATEQAIEDAEAATRPTVPIREEEPYVQPPKEEFKAAFARMTPESIAETEANFREQLQSEDEETRVFSQNALDALAEFRAEQARARKLPTDVLPTETPGATYGREADIYDVFADVRRRPMPPSGPAFESAQVIEEAARRADVLRRTPEGRDLLRRELQGEEMVGGVRRATEEALATAPEPAEGDVFAEIRRPSRAEEAAITIEQQLAEDERIRRSQLGAEALREELAQAESLSRVADNTATDEEVVRLARQGLVNIQDGQNVITPRGEEVMQRAGAPLPRLTPEERAAEVAAAPAAPTPVTTPLVTPTPEAAVAPVEPVVAAEGAVEPAVIEVAPETVQAAEQKATEDFAQDLYGQEPYINHLRRVSEQMPNNKLKTAAFLHDSVEDGKMTLDEVRSQFGDDVAGLVDVVSRKEGETYAQFIDRVAQNPEAAQIKLADLRENIRNVENFKPSLRSRYEKAIAVLEPEVAPATAMTEDAKTRKALEEQPPASLETVLQQAEASRKFREQEEPAGIAIGNRVKTKTTPQSFVVEEVLPQSAREAELGEQYYSIRNERTGEVQTVEAGDIKIVRGKGVRKMAATPTKITPQTPEETTAFQKASSNKVMARNPELAVAAVRLKNGEITAGEYADLIDSIDPFTVKGAESIPTKDKIDKYIGEDKRSKVNAPIQSGKEVEFRIDIPTYNRSTAAGDTVYAVTAHEPVPETSTRVGTPISYLGAAKVINPKMMTRSISGKGEAIDIATGAVKFPLATVKGNYEPITNLPADINNPDVWTEVSYNPIRSSYFVDVRSKNAVVGGDEAIMVGSRVFVKNPQMQARPRGIVGGAGIRDIRYMASELRAEEKYTPVPEADRYTFREASGRAIRFFGGEKPENFVIVNNTDDPDYEFKAGYDPDSGEIILNRAYIQRGENIEDILTHELGHYIYSDPQFQADFQSFLESMPDEARAEIDRIVNEGYNKETNEVQIEEREVMAFASLIRRTKRGLTAWEKLKDTIKKIINRLLKTNIMLSDRGAMAVFNVGYKRFNSGERIIREMREGVLKMAPEPTPAPEAVVEEAPAERPKRRTKMQNIIDISTGVKRPKTKLTVNEMTALKDQIRMGARKRKEDKRTQREFAKDLTQQLREAAIRGKVRPSQLRAITSKALQTQFDNEASILGFVNYANKVIENANYEKDLSDAKSAIKSAKRLAKQKGLAANIKANLEKLANIEPRQIEPEEMVEVEGETPISVAEFTAVLKEYMKAGGPVTAEEYVLVPDAEITDFLTKLGEQIETNRKAKENLGMDGELAAIADKTPEEIDAELARDEERRNRIEQKINGLAEVAQVALINYDNPEITSEEKVVLDDMKRITLSDISIGERKEFIKIANNILVNNKFLGAQKFASMARGQIGAVEAAKDSKTIKRNSATLKVYENLLGENFGRLVNLGTQSFADTFRNLTGTQGLPRLLYQMGFGEIERGQANTNRARREITDGVQQRFKQIEKETGQRIAETQGVYSMGVAGNLIQIHPDETEAEGIQRMRGLIEKDIEKKKKSPKTEDRKTALYIEKALDEVYADSIQGILDNLNRLHPANYKALTFLMNEVLPEYKPLLKEHDELFNNQTENYENPYYLPIRYRSIGTEPKKPGELRGRASDSVTAPKQAPNSIKRIKNSVLPEGKQFDYNLTRNVLDSLSTQLEAAYTNPGWQQVYAFLKSPEAVEALGGVENYDFVTKRINNLSDSRERKIYQMDPFNQAADFVANMVRKIGTSIALGGIGQAAKQMPDQVATTIANVNDLSITTPAFTEIKAALPAMRQFSIGERGEIAGGSKWVNQLEGNFTKLQQFMQDGLWPKAMEAFENLNNFWLIPLKISDTVAASHGWISYYKKYLKDNDIQFTNWDNESDLIAKGDRSRVEAGLYADQMIDIYQGSSDPTKMATFAQRGDSGGGNLLKTMIMPFSSFVIQQRSRILSDLRDISYGDTDEKKVAAKGLAGTLLGIVIFHGVRRYALPFLTGGIAAAAYGLLGVDMEEPDEEERLEKERRVFRQFLGEVASNIFVGGYSAYAETRLIDAVNAAAYFYEIQTQSENVLDDKGEIMSWEKYRKERAPMYRYTGPGADSTLGMLDILPSQARESFDRLKDLSDDEIMDSLTEEEQRVLILAALSETLYTMRLNDADVARMVKRMAKDVKDQAEARQKAERQLQRIYGQ